VDSYKELVALERVKAKGDFFFYAKEVFGNRKMNRRVHGELCDALQGWRRLKNGSKEVTEILVLMPRGTYKSSIVTQAFSSWVGINEPDSRILIVNEVKEKAEEYLGVIKNVHEKPYHIELFGDTKNDKKTKKPVRWGADSITFATRTDAGMNLREPSVSTGAPGATKTGMHYDYIIADDIVSEKTVTNKEQIEKTLRYYRQLQSLLDPGGLLIIVGTRYLYDDLYGFLIEKKTPDRVIIKKSIDEAGKILFPEEQDEAFLDDKLSKLGPYMFGCQYLNEPTNAENAIFTEEMISRIDPESLNPSRRKALLVDFSRGESGHSDFSACVVVSQHNFRYYVEHAEQRRCAPDRLIDWIYDLHKMMKFDVIGIEQVGAQSMFDWIMNLINIGAREYIPLVPVKTSNTSSKNVRIQAIQPFYVNKTLVHAGSFPHLEQQLFRFPAIAHDDLVDALSMFNRVLSSGKEEAKPEEVEDNRRKVSVAAILKKKRNMESEPWWLQGLD
jgi:predicted phage terminase large subunit-like protein